MSVLPTIGIEFLDLVATMRKAQDDFFKSRSSRDLARAKKLESLVDAKIDGFRRDYRKLDDYLATLKTDELPGLYEVPSKA